MPYRWTFREFREGVIKMGRNALKRLSEREVLASMGGERPAWSR